MLTVFLGAGFSALAGVPVAAHLFDEVPDVDRVRREGLVQRVLAGWRQWHERTGGMPEQYLAYLQEQRWQQWYDAVWFVSLVSALRMGSLQSVGGKPTIVRHNLNRASGIDAYEEFWDIVFSSRFGDRVAVVTTNYDIVAERGLRTGPRARKPRYGFHYGQPNEYLLGRGYPSYAHIKPVQLTGRIPLLKLHGSVSWSLRSGVVEHYYDCRPAIRGDAAIIAPTTEKSIPAYLRDTWVMAGEYLSRSESWVVVGYSFPEYDEAVSNLLRARSAHGPVVHIFTPDSGPAVAAGRLLTSCTIVHHSGLPHGLDDLQEVLG